MSEPARSTVRRTGTGFGRILVFVYGILAFAATGRATFELASKFSEAPVPYALSMVAAVVYVVATWALATDRRRIALAAVSFELVGVLAVGVSSLV
jgi:cytochrome bd-type quinol oxidase subunit 2